MKRQYPTVLPSLRVHWDDACAEHRFHATRMWRFDFAIPSLKIAVEINGGVWSNGRHSRGSGLVLEYEKMRAAAILGWRVLPFTPQELPIIVPSVRLAANADLPAHVAV